MIKRRVGNLIITGIVVALPAIKQVEMIRRDLVSKL